MRRVVIAVSLVALLIALAAPAVAYVAKWGTQNCAGSHIPFVESFASGEVQHEPPGFGYAEYSLPVMAVRRTHAPAGNGGFWRVTTDGVLSSPGTFAGCHASGAS